LIDEWCKKNDSVTGRRAFLKTAMASTVAATSAPGLLHAGRFQSDLLQVWACGGLSEAFKAANSNYEKRPE